MMKDMLKKVKDFAEDNWCKDEAEQIYADDEEFAVANPWIDHSGRFTLDDAGAVKEWGLDVVIDFYEKAKAEIGRKERSTLCGFVWCYGEKDFSVWEVNLKPHDIAAIEKILSQYETSGTSVRGAWDEKISDIFSKNY